MDNCWFVLKQVHYYPPPDDCIRQGTPDAPVCLGHLISGLRHIDHVINAAEFVPFEHRMKPARPTTRHDFTWDHATGRGVCVLDKASLPIAAIVPGVEASATIGALFSKRVANYRRFASLEMWITCPTRAYVNKAIKTREFLEHLERTSVIPGCWTVYMITGLAIARGAKRMQTTESKEVSLLQGVGCQIPGLGEAGPEASLTGREHSVITERDTTDFVWAVRLSKITKNGLQRNWSIETVFGRVTVLGRKAAFSATAAEPEFDPRPVLAGEQLSDADFEVTTVKSEAEQHFITMAEEEEEEQKEPDGSHLSPPSESNIVSPVG